MLEFVGTELLLITVFIGGTYVTTRFLYYVLGAR